ncbi:copper fist DNA binding domain-domain-containing protein [Absidia repens]|uniref:Copper fist DNA binding domain-domain-containing protein n=1 Tax=Absidia repens TaxID=90262 RepID=A0A1X2IN78_9FUNG|nr:copper fist DNA binding domain-domain-containing protein [Absidia repens]
MVIEKDGVKYACLPCIRGHRVKKCQHHNRQLSPLSKRGRQVTQCNHCRDLRSSGSHVKCTCASASVLNRLDGCLCEISQTCTCVARHLQNIQTTTTSFDDSPMLWLPSDLPASSSGDAFQNLQLFTSHDQQNSASLSTTSPDTPSSHQPTPHCQDIQRSPTNSSQALTSSSNPPPEQDLIDMFLHKDIDDLLSL